MWDVDEDRDEATNNTQHCWERRALAPQHMNGHQDPLAPAALWLGAVGVDRHWRRGWDNVVEGRAYYKGTSWLGKVASRSRGIAERSTKRNANSAMQCCAVLCYGWMPMAIEVGGCGHRMRAYVSASFPRSSFHYEPVCSSNVHAWRASPVSRSRVWGLKERSGGLWCIIILHLLRARRPLALLAAGRCCPRKPLLYRLWSGISHGATATTATRGTALLRALLSPRTAAVAARPACCGLRSCGRCCGR